LKRSSGIVTKLSRNNSGGPGAHAVAPNAATTAIKLAIELAVPQRLGRENLHAYRLKVKELLYLLQMAAGASDEKVLADLAEVKDAIGEWHDWGELVLIGQESLDYGNRCGVVTELKRIAKNKYEHALAMAQELRQEYLRSSSPKKKGVSAGATRVPSYAVWQAVARLAG
jgi:CHAD domain-containing protein